MLPRGLIAQFLRHFAHPRDFLRLFGPTSPPEAVALPALGMCCQSCRAAWASTGVRRVHGLAMQRPNLRHMTRVVFASRC